MKTRLECEKIVKGIKFVKSRDFLVQDKNRLKYGEQLWPYNGQRMTVFCEQILCSVVAGFLHFVFLAAFAWMCLEGIQLYVMLIEVFEVERSRIGWYYTAGYGMP